MAGFAGGAALMARTRRMVAASARPAESAIADRLAVAIGPIAIAAGRTAELIAGDLVDCGVDPAGDVRGLLCRSDGSFWPILIEGDQVVVCGPVQSPAAIATAKELLATLEIGSVELRARQRISLEAGDRIPFARAAANSARMRLAHGGEVAGGLELIDGVLAFRASGKRRADDPENTFGIVVLLLGTAFLPIIAVTVTAFAKIAIVVFLVRNALGVQQLPPTSPHRWSATPMPPSISAASSSTPSTIGAKPGRPRPARSPPF